MWSAGYIYDLIGRIHQYLLDIGYKSLPIHILSHTAKHSLEISNILGEWMEDEFESKLYSADQPLPHSHLIQTKRLVLHESLQTLFDYKAPLIVFSSSPFYEFGKTDELIRVLRERSLNPIVVLTGKRTSIFTEP